MSVRVRLTRVGSKKNPIWRVVVTDQRSPRDGRFIEQIGHYNPRTEPSTIVIDRERLDHWIELGAQPTNTIKKLMRAKPPEPPAADADAAAEEVPADPAAANAEGGTDEPDPDAGSEPTEAEPDAEGEASGDAEATEPAEAS